MAQNPEAEILLDPSVVEDLDRHASVQCLRHQAMMKFKILGCYRDRSGKGFPAARYDRRKGSTAEPDRIGARPLCERARMCPAVTYPGSNHQSRVRQHRVLR
jgi:hypothetical protein